MTILFAILYAIFVSLGKNVLRLSFKEFPPSVGFFLETLFGICIWVPFAFAVGVEFADVINIFPIVLISAILSEAYPFYMYSKGKLSIIVSVFATYSVYTLIFSHLFFGERLTVELYIFIAMCIVGIFILSMPDKKDLVNKRSALYSILWATSGAIAVGFSDSISADRINSTSIGAFMFCLAFAQLPVSIGYLFAEKQTPLQVVNVKREFAKYKFAILSGGLIALAQLFFWLAFEGSLASITSPITSSQVMFSVLLSFIILKERLTKRQYLGIFIIATSVILISTFS